MDGKQTRRGYETIGRICSLLHKSESMFVLSGGVWHQDRFLGRTSVNGLHFVFPSEVYNHLNR